VHYRAAQCAITSQGNAEQEKSIFYPLCCIRIITKYVLSIGVRARVLVESFCIATKTRLGLQRHGYATRPLTFRLQLLQLTQVSYDAVRCTIRTTCAPVLRFEQLRSSYIDVRARSRKFDRCRENTAARMHLLIRLMARLCIVAQTFKVVREPGQGANLMFHPDAMFVPIIQRFHLHAMFAQLLVDEGVDNGHLYNSGKIQARPTMASSSIASIATVL